MAIFRGAIFPAFNPAPGQYDFNARPDQVWVMQQAKARGVHKLNTTRINQYIQRYEHLSADEEILCIRKFQQTASTWSRGPAIPSNSGKFRAVIAPKSVVTYVGQNG